MTTEIIASPSKCFEWCLEHADTPAVPFRSNYPQYYTNVGTADYLWHTYNRRLADIIPLVTPGARVLEIGCGIGADLHWVALRGARATGIDVKSEWVSAARQLTEIVRKHFREVTVDVQRVNLLDIGSEQFDLIYMKDTFHHLEPRRIIVSKLSDLLAPNGRIVIIEPNGWNPFIQYKMFKIRGLRTVIEKIDAATGERFIYGNERLLAGGTLERLFRSVGIEGKSRRLRLLPTALARRPALVRVADVMERMGLDTVLAPLAIHCVYVGEKRSG